ncbi:hypothetical protein [Conservatibacter flavescens]|uniref:Uncharacterized protein n=1 Tax=Conservatibacter flavescens TaxID=28161 RepID=A0A2M8RZ83_9PAST|nr:hypothetical protein [Conservatibacter flavescens]PJG84207.1 hypothetical protein CVP05_12520 [Conservatibacter flavescens]
MKEWNNPKSYTQSTITNSNDFICVQRITRPKDYIIIVASALMTTKDKIGKLVKQQRDIINDNLIGDYEGNAYMFINQGIRAIKKYNDKIKSDRDSVILIVFEEGYTFNDKKIIEFSAKSKNTSLFFVKNVDELINILNARKNTCREIQEMEIYSHGLPGGIEFHYDIAYYYNEHIWIKIMKKDGTLNKTMIDKLDKKIFSKSARVRSYACRTGISEWNESFTNSNEAKPENSLAQYIADKLQVTVEAYEKRSLYDQTYNVEDEEDEDILILEREKNDRNNGGPIMSDGAIKPPISGDTPRGLKDDLQTYFPNN